jgi:hypothetical protein
MKSKATVAGTTITIAPASRLYRKFAKDGVMNFYPLSRQLVHISSYRAVHPLKSLLSGLFSGEPLLMQTQNLGADKDRI